MKNVSEFNDSCFPTGVCPVSDKMNYTERTLCVLKFEDLDTKALINETQISHFFFSLI